MVPHRRRRRRRIILLSLILLATPGVAWAAMAVIDSSAIAKLTNQLSKMQEQIQVLTGISDRVQKQIDAVGKMGKISLPILNAAKLASQIQRDVQCLKPDLSKLMPGIDLEDMDINSVCEGAPVYEQTLWVDPEKINKMPNWSDREDSRRQVERRRQAVLKDAVTKGMAQADVSTKDVEQTNRAANELESSVASATTSNDRLQTIAQGQVLIVRALAQQNQILAQQLKVQSATTMAIGVPVESLNDPKKTEAKK